MLCSCGPGVVSGNTANSDNKRRPCWQLDSSCLLNSTWRLEDVDDVEGLCGKVLDNRLRRWGATLNTEVSNQSARECPRDCRGGWSMSVRLLGCRDVRADQQDVVISVRGRHHLRPGRAERAASVDVLESRGLLGGAVRAGPDTVGRAGGATTMYPSVCSGDIA